MNDWMSSLSKGTPRIEVESYFRNLVGMNNNFEQTRWSNSLKNRGIKEAPISKFNLEEDFVPGVLV